MRLVLLTHPAAFDTASMPRFADMIRHGMVARGHTVEMWTSQPSLSRLSERSAFVRKWLGYIDQFLIYPNQLNRQVALQPKETLFVVADQALGIWVPRLAHRPHVIHCHDFMALQSALGEFPENPTGFTGRQYQRLIRRGFARGRAFISVSENSRTQLHRFLPRVPDTSEVVYNGLNHPFHPMEKAERLGHLKPLGQAIPESGFVLHVGGNQWYKNRPGVIEIYRAYAKLQARPADLWLIGSQPTEELQQQASSVPGPGKIHFLKGLSNEQVNAAYAEARALLFPSLGEGFGWPIIEAMTAGCPVITTDLAPMTEVAGGHARLIPRMPFALAERERWASAAAATLDALLRLNEDERADLLRRSRQHAAQFQTENALSAYEKIYSRLLSQHGKEKASTTAHKTAILADEMLTK